MFSLLATVIAILLVTAFTLATVYYGGSALLESGDKAALARIQNEGTQITGAATLHRATQGQPAESIDQLVASRYLQAPPSLAWGVYQDAAVLTNVDSNVCTTLNEEAGVSGIPMCDDPSIAGRTVCCQQP